VAYDERLAERVRALLAAEPDLSERKMFGGIGFMLGGRVCAGVHGDRLIARVPDDVAARELARPHASPFDLTGRAMSGWIYIAPEGLRTAAALRRWVELGTQVARAAPPPKRAKPRAPRPGARATRAR
jgi:TfoX/Sxy family transcriptional regulator of competence genes